jgi:ATP-dependent helicase/nuclease subunit A
VLAAGPRFDEMQAAHRRDLNMLAARGLRRMFAVASTEYRRTLDAHASLDFSDVLLRTLDLLRLMEEFAQSRYRLESRYQHVLVDEFQDTSRAQWELVRLLIQAWGEGRGLSASGPLLPSIFIVGDRKQSIYGFREADVAILREAGRHLGTLRGGSDVRRSISRSHRSAPPLLAFVNDVCADMDKAPDRPDGFAYDEQDRFPLAPADTEAEVAAPATPEAPALGLVVDKGPEACADAVAAEIARLVREGVEIRDRGTGLPRAVRPGDISVLFRTREAHRELEQALERRGLPVYVYKGLGFYDADEVKDVLAILRYLADPFSDLRAAALARSRLVRLSDEGLRRLAPRIAQAFRGAGPLVDEDGAGLDAADREALARVRPALARWRGLVDRIPPADLLDRVLAESAYALELGGPRARQARENLKKIRALVRRVENRGYATLERIAAHLDRLSVGEEPNAVIDALDAVNLMTVHAAKGLEFPVVFVVNLTRGTGGRPAPVRISTEAGVPGVGVGSFQSEADEDRVAREREETKRLVYVALTRARDRLYLGAVQKDDGLVVGRGSLAEVLPGSLVDVIRTGGDTWTARSGATHRFRVVHADERAEAPSLRTEPVDERADTPSLRTEPVDERAEAPSLHTRGDLDRAPLPVTRPPTTVTALLAPGTAVPTSGGGTASSQVVGTLVHRMLERMGGAAPDDPVTLAAAAGLLLAPDEAGAPGDAVKVAARAADLYARIRRRPDVARLYASGGERFHEVPFSTEVDGRVVRGAIDCLVREGDRVTILEFKTGRRHATHDEQGALYRRAVEGLFPGAEVEVRVVYPDGPA